MDLAVIPCGGSGIADGACDCFGNVEDNCGVCGGDNTSCSWTELSAEVEAINNITLSWDAVNSSRTGTDNRECSAEVCLSIENIEYRAVCSHCRSQTVCDLGKYNSFPKCLERLGFTV